MKLVTFRKNLYSVSQIAIAVPVLRKVNAEQSIHAAEEDGEIAYSSQNTTTWMITLPWIRVKRIEFDPADLFVNLEESE